MIGLRTGARAYWAGRAAPSGAQPWLPEYLLDRGGDSLLFLSQWCYSMVATGFRAEGRHDAERLDRPWPIAPPGSAGPGAPADAR